MTILPCPYADSFSPYVFAKKCGAPWLKDVEKEIHELIEQMAEQLYAERTFTHDLQSCDEEYIYRWFKENSEHVISDTGNWVLLKYFSRLFYIKILKEMVGEWTFTAEDKEMYEYFCNIKVDDSNRIKPRFFNYKSGVEITGKNMIMSSLPERKIYIEAKSDIVSANNVITVNYYEFFNTRLFAADNMLRNAKMLAKFVQDYNFFSDDCFKTSSIESLTQRYGNELIYSIKPLIPNWEKERENPKITMEEFNRKLKQYVDEDSAYSIMLMELEKYRNKLIYKFKNSPEGKKLLSCVIR